MKQNKVDERKLKIIHMWQNGLKPRAIAKHFNLSPGYVYNILYEAGIKIRVEQAKGEQEKIVAQKEDVPCTKPLPIYKRVLRWILSPQ